MSEVSADIIIPVWNQPDLTVRCLETIREHATAYRIILVDNGSEPDAFEAIDAELANHPHLLIRNCENEGFVKATNRGIVAASAPFVCLMNNDTEAVEGWKESLLLPFAEDDRIGATGPLTTTGHSWQGKHAAEPGWRLLNTNAMLAFFCTFFRREVFEKVGLLDEEYGVGFGDDDDYCSRVHLAGYRLGLTTEIVIPHHHRTTFKENYSDEELVAMQTKAMARFKDKDRVKSRKREWTLGMDMVAKGDSIAGTDNALRSIMPQVDEATVLIDRYHGEDAAWVAERHGATVLEGTAPDYATVEENGFRHIHFAESREIVRHAGTSDWVIWLDADEILADPGNLLHAIDDANRNNLDTVSLVLSVSHDAGTFRKDQIRVFRRSACHWIYPCHNKLVREGETVIGTGVIRTSYVGQNENRYLRQRPALEKMWVEATTDGERINASYHLSKVMVTFGEYDAVAHWCAKCIQLDGDSDCRAPVWDRYVRALMELGRQEEAEKVLDEALKRFAGFPDLEHAALALQFKRYWQASLETGGRFAHVVSRTKEFARNAPQVAKLLNMGVREER